jgi:hypothetical protein
MSSKENTVPESARVRDLVRCTLAAGAATMLLVTPAGARQAPGRQPVNTQAAALQDFQHRLDEYLQLRTALVRELKPLVPTPNAVELAARQTALAVALKNARAGAAPGSLVPPAVADQISAAIRDDFARRSAADERATFSEVPNAPQPAINQTYPADAALPTVPPLLLRNLPRLPDNLQYRFFGRHVLILDGDAGLIVDYIANVLPPH